MCIIYELYDKSPLQIIRGDEIASMKRLWEVIRAVVNDVVVNDFFQWLF